MNKNIYTNKIRNKKDKPYSGWSYLQVKNNAGNVELNNEIFNTMYNSTDSIPNCSNSLVDGNTSSTVSSGEAGGMGESVEMDVRQAFQEMNNCSTSMDNYSSSSPLQYYYHGSNSKFNFFSVNKIDFKNAKIPGFWFTKNKEEAYAYGNNIVKVKLSFNKSISTTRLNLTPEQVSQLSGYPIKSCEQALQHYDNDYDLINAIIPRTANDTYSSFIEKLFTITGYDYYVYENNIVVLSPEQITIVKDENNLQENINQESGYRAFDNEGNPLTQEQIDFFKDSKVRDNKGRLLVCYHGTTSEFNVFNMESTRQGMAGHGFYFTDNYNKATHYAKDNEHTLRCYLNITNPVYSDGTQNHDWYRKGDGYIWSRPRWKEFVVRDPSQIKLTTNKNPTSNQNLNERYEEIINNDLSKRIQDWFYEAFGTTSLPNRAMLLTDGRFLDVGLSPHFILDDFFKHELRLYETLLSGNDPKTLIDKLRKGDNIIVNQPITLNLSTKYNKHEEIDFSKNQLLTVVDGSVGENYPYIIINDGLGNQLSLYEEHLEELQATYYLTNDDNKELTPSDIPFTLEEIKQLREISNHFSTSSGCPVLEDLGCVRLNAQREFYMVLPKKQLTNNQYNALEDWFDKVLFSNIAKAQKWRRGMFEISTSEEKSTQYDLIDITSDYLIKRIKRYYSSGELYENNPLNENLLPLKTLNGSSIKRSKYGVGKEIGGKIYFHKNYALDIIPKDIYNKACKLLPDDFSFTCLVYNPKIPNVIRFDEAPDFDTAREPHPGKIITTNINTNTIVRGYSDQVWHHRWLWVKDNYTGFDIQQSYEWSKKWLEKITHPSGYRNKWEQELRDAGLYNYSEKDK